MMTPAAAASPAIGLVLRRPRRDMLDEPFYDEIVAGMERVLSRRGLHVLMQVVASREEELACYARWHRGHSVAGVMLTDLWPDDIRPALLAEYGIPSVILGDPEKVTGMAVVRSDDFGAMSDAVNQLAELGHRTIGRISGPGELLHTRARTEAFNRVTGSLGITGIHIEGDYSATSGAECTRTLLASRDRPSAIIYDNDVMAVAGLNVALEAGLDVPEQLSILAWDDSTLCRLARRPLSAMSHDVHEVGVLAAQGLLALIDGEQVTDVTASQPIFVPRASTGPPVEALRGTEASRP
jgi:DNA-binding LacI/PurR family transcriptional regulator